MNKLLKEENIKKGQTWISADGSGLTVEVLEVNDGWVYYMQFNGVKHQKIHNAFQTRYSISQVSLELLEIELLEDSEWESEDSLVLNGLEVSFDRYECGDNLTETARFKDSGNVYKNEGTKEISYERWVGTWWGGWN